MVRKGQNTSLYPLQADSRAVGSLDKLPQKVHKMPALMAVMILVGLIEPVLLSSCAEGDGYRIESGNRSQTLLAASNKQQDQEAPKETPRAQMSLGQVRGTNTLPVTDQPVQQPAKPEAVKLHLAGQDLLEKGQIDQGKEKLEEGLRLDPNNYVIRRDLARIAIVQGRVGDALDHISATLKIDPDHMEMYVLEARVAASRSQEDQAIQSYALSLLCSDAVNNNPQTGQTLLALSRLLIKQGYLRAAIETQQRLGVVVSEISKRAEPKGLSGVDADLQKLAQTPGRIWLSIGKLHAELNEAESAIQAYRKARELSREDTEVQALCVRGLAEAGEFDEAFDIVDELADDVGTRPAAAGLLVWIRDKQGKGAKCVEDLNLLRSRYPRDSRIAIVLASYYRRTDQVDEARKILVKEISFNRRFLPSYQGLSELELQAGERAEAVRWLAKMVRVRKTSILDARWRISRIAGGKEQAGKLLNELEGEKELKRDFSLSWAAGTLAESAELPSQAQAHYRQAISLEPHFGQLHLYLIRSYLREGQADQALATVAQAEKSKVASSSDFYRVEGLAHLLNDDPDASIVCLEAAVGAEPTDAAAREVLASSLLAVGRPGEAVKHLAHLASENPDEQSLYQQLITAHLADGRADAASEVAEEFMAQHDELDDKMALVVAEAMLAGEKPSQAVKVLEKLSVPRRYVPRWQELLVEALVRSGELMQAQEKLAGWLEQANSASKRTELIVRMAAVLAQADKKTLAVKIVSDKLDADPDNQFLREILIWILLQKEDYKRAKTLTTDWLAEKQDRRGKLLWITVLLAEEEYEQAEGELKSLLGADAKDVRSLHLLGGLYESTEQIELACEQYQKVLEISPDDVWANNNLGFYWADTNKHLDEAERMIRQALRGAGAEGAVVDSMGWVLYKQGRFGQGQVYLSRAVRLTSEPGAEVLEHLGDTHCRLAEAEKASQIWEQALQVERSSDKPNGERLRRLQNKLELIESGQVPPLAWSVVDNPVAAERTTSEPTANRVSEVSYVRTFALGNHSPKKISRGR